jgi:tRNA-splicing ligase RtcB
MTTVQTSTDRESPAGTNLTSDLEFADAAIRTNTIPFGQFIEPEGPDEIENTRDVIQHMDALMRVPTIVGGAIMPDACPSGPVHGTIPVGGVVAARNAIHPGFHSSDICCSMAITIFKRDMPVAKVLDIAMQTTHFGTGKREAPSIRQNKELVSLIRSFENNPFLRGLEGFAEYQFLTQGDGNHFFYVGRLESSGQLCIVTHHGSRGLGAQLYKRGMAAASRHASIVAPRIPNHNAWIEADSQVGQDYWAALQTVRQWTKFNHFGIHDLMQQRMGNAIVGRFWNEHNFVFQRSDGLFYHAKGATPSYRGFSPDDQGMTLIPLNMSEPILIAQPADRADALGFAPHGAGRNMSRATHKARLIEEFGADDRGLAVDDIAVMLERETRGIDVRFFTGLPDVSELPSGYKNAAQVTGQIEKHGLAKVTDRILPLGSLMAGEPAWDKKKR